MRKSTGSKRGESVLIQGSCVIEEILTREHAAKKLKPQVTERQLRTYLDLASLYLPTFTEFRDKENGGLNRNIKLTNWHIPTLQLIRTKMLLIGLKKTTLELAKYPERFGVNHDH
jgi:hypothetical protein